MLNFRRKALLTLLDLSERNRRFAKDESGMITIFTCFMIVMMAMVCGIGVDIMRHEMERNRLQSVADRAVLAAADLDQTLDPEAVVRDYFSKSGMADFVSSVSVTEGLNFRTVTVDASLDMNTQFMDTMGVDTLRVPALSAAEEKVSKVEISMVLDISGSMNDNNKMANLQDASAVFLDTVLDESNEDLISVSLVPYSEHVNAGPLIFNQLNINQQHYYSHCIEFDEPDFYNTEIDTTRTFWQMQHFQWNYYSVGHGNTNNTRYDTVCPRRGYERIVPLSQDVEYLKRQIRKFKPRAGTQIFMGMKWASILLDPTFRPLNDHLISGNRVDAAFSGRPVDYSDTETLKTVILMTDGQNSTTSRITNTNYNTNSKRVHWNKFNLQYYLLNYVSWEDRASFYYEKYTEDYGDFLLDNICDAAKDKGIVIWTIGFEVQDHGAGVMKNCASSPSHFFRVENAQIHDAFQAIARQIRQLRLTQ